MTHRRPWRRRSAALADALQRRIDDLQAELRESLGRYDAIVAQLQARLQFDMSVHFEFDKADVRGEDLAAPNACAEVMRKHHPGALVTVEGFADPAGPEAYTLRLGQRRAQAVLDYLVSGGMNAAKPRAVSYGVSGNRAVVPGAHGPGDGIANRRVVLVIDDPGTG